jgi:hypothetical protein
MWNGSHYLARRTELVTPNLEVSNRIDLSTELRHSQQPVPRAPAVVDRCISVECRIGAVGTQALFLCA